MPLVKCYFKVTFKAVRCAVIRTEKFSAFSTATHSHYFPSVSGITHISHLPLNPPTRDAICILLLSAQSSSGDIRSVEASYHTHIVQLHIECVRLPVMTSSDVSALCFYSRDARAAGVFTWIHTDLTVILMPHDQQCHRVRPPTLPYHELSRKSAITSTSSETSVNVRSLSLT